MANNDLRGRRIVDSKPFVRAPLDEYGFPTVQVILLPPYFYNFPQALRNAEGIMYLTSITCFVTLHNRKDTRVLKVRLHITSVCYVTEVVKVLIKQECIPVECVPAAH